MHDGPAHMLTRVAGKIALLALQTPTQPVRASAAQGMALSWLRQNAKNETMEPSTTATQTDGTGV